MKNKTRLLIVLAGALALALGAYTAWQQRRPAGPPPKLMVIGLDAFTWDILGPMVERGEMPHLKSLMDRGVHGPLKTLRSTYISAAIWTTILTGKQPKYHGIEGWFSTAGFPVNSTNRTVKFLPEMLGESGIPAAILGFWATWPADRINGYVVSDLASYGRFKDFSRAVNLKVRDFSYLREIEDATWPPELLDDILPVMRAPSELPRAFYEAVLPMNDEEWEKFSAITAVSRSDELALLKFAAVTDYNFHLAGLEILRAKAPEAYLVYFQGPDIIEHFFWKYREPEYFKDSLPPGHERYRNVIRDYYRFMDRLVGETLEYAGPDTIILALSDHGMERVAYLGQDNLHSGQHRVSKPPGVFIMAGPMIRQEPKPVEGLVVTDITPTLLYLLGLPAGRDMQGTQFTGVATDDFQRRNPPRLIDSWDAGLAPKADRRSPLDDDIKQRLRSIGYLD